MFKRPVNSYVLYFYWRIVELQYYMFQVNNMVIQYFYILCKIQVLQYYRLYSLFSSVQFSHSVMPDSLWPHGLQHARPPCPSPTPRVYPNSCPLNWWCHPTISSFVIPFFSCLQSFPASVSFQMSQLFASGGLSIRVSASTSVLPMNSQDWSPLG